MALTKPLLPGLTPWPQDEAEHYRATGCWIGQTFSDVLSARAAETPAAVAVVDDLHNWTYAELDRRARSLATGLVRLGIRPRDRVMVQLPNIAEFVEVVFALFQLGALPVFCLPAHRIAELTPIARDSGAVALITCGHNQGFDYLALANSVRKRTETLHQLIIVADRARPRAELPADVHDIDSLRLPEDSAALVRSDPADVAFLQLSGGSTGVPKLIPRTHDDYLYSVRRSAEICQLDQNTVYLVTLPVAHNFPMSSPGILGTIWAGGTIAMAADPTPTTAFAAIERFGATITGMVPPLARLWVERAEAAAIPDISSLRVLQVGGARCPEELARRITPALGAAVQQVFGMAEGLVCYTRLDDPEEIVMGSQGRPMSEYDLIRVVDDDGNDVPTGTDGLLITKGPYTIRGYYNNPDANARSFTADGWYRTGDIAVLHPDGNIVVNGRAGDWVNRGGEKVSAEELEEHLLTHPQIRDAVVVAAPDARLGQRICVFVMPADPAAPPTLPAVRAYVRERGLAAWKLPDSVEVVDHFPETGVGKTSRRALRQLLTPVTTNN